MHCTRMLPVHRQLEVRTKLWALTNCFIWTHVLRGISILDGPIPTFHQRRQSVRSILKINSDPISGCVYPTRVLNLDRVGTLQISCKRVIEAFLFDNHFDSRVAGPFQTKESRHEILGALPRCQHIAHQTKQPHTPSTSDLASSCEQ